MIKIIQGNCIDKLKELDDESVQCVVTSPPYWGLRDYGESDQLGLEETPQEYVQSLVNVFREVKRVLRDDGTVWLNLGDSYNNQSTNRTGQNGYNDGRLNRNKRFSIGGVKGLKIKDLVGIPWRVAFALQDDGWYLRQDIIWAKPNPMPESVTDRCTKSHEYIFLLTKSAKYYYDAEAIKEESMNIGETNAKFGGNKYGDNDSKKHLTYSGNKYTDNGKRNKRDVWTITTKPYSEAHFATFPTEIPELCIKAGTKQGDVVLDMFAGAGTTGLVADRLGRDSILIELNKDYTDMLEKRIYNDAPMFVEIESSK